MTHLKCETHHANNGINLNMNKKFYAQNVNVTHHSTNIYLLLRIKWIDVSNYYNNLQHKRVKIFGITIYFISRQK